MTIAPTRPLRKMTPEEEEDFYPTGDGKPMAESRLHIKQMNATYSGVQYHLRHRRNVWVSGNDYIYYLEGSNQHVVSPDCYVCFDVVEKERLFYKLWEEGGIVPAIIFEFTSKKTFKADIGWKQDLYESWGVLEYVMFDPTGKCLKPPLQGKRLENGKYVDIELVNGNRIYSEQLGLDLVAEGERLRFFDPLTGEWLPNFEEAIERAEEFAYRAEVEADRADEEKQRADREEQRADDADLARLVEQRRAEAEAQRADAAERELALLRAQLEVLQKKP